MNPAAIMYIQKEDFKRLFSYCPPDLPSQLCSLDYKIQETTNSYAFPNNQVQQLFEWIMDCEVVVLLFQPKFLPKIRLLKGLWCVGISQGRQYLICERENNM